MLALVRHLLASNLIGVRMSGGRGGGRGRVLICEFNPSAWHCFVFVSVNTSECLN